MSTKQKVNTRSSTEAELVGVNDAIGMALWTKQFLECQGYDISDNLIYQDNQSAMLLEKNGRKSSGKKTRCLDIHYYYITDQIARKNARVAYCPTNDMIGDFFTKPLQGSKFTRFRNAILNVKGSEKVPLPGEIHVADLRPITGQECVENNTDRDRLPSTAGQANTSSMPIGPACVRVRNPDDREWHQATRRPNRPNPVRFKEPGIRPTRKM